ncbi:sensor histidine kinase [Nocardia harenae]|uniref:sensor histidine kinase n=1 Tax=Nocardia harenae TaxID=358707 RepID=UPI000A07A9D4|nr:histidine kinase [Nocardia harenae]
MSATMWVDAVTVFVAVACYSVAWPTLHVTHVVTLPVQPFLAAFAAFPLLLVRVNPALGWAVSAGSALLFAVAVPHQPGSDLPFSVVHLICLIVLLFAVGVLAPMPLVAVAWASTSLLVGATMPGDGALFGWPLGFAALVLFALLIRWLVLSRRQLSAFEEENELERARRAILEEKARIARDLHDVVAHHMSLVVVQAQTAPYRVEDVSAGARAEFESIGATAREALNEIRGMLGVLRSDGQLPEHAPQPSAADLPALLDATRRAGVPLSWTVEGSLDGVPETVGLALYRIVQESLANASRHAAGADVQVAVVVGAELTVWVGNGPGTPGPAGNGGHGLAGMHARAVAVGGELVAGERPGGGFDVRARLPLAAGVTLVPAAAPQATAPHL